MLLYYITGDTLLDASNPAFKKRTVSQTCQSTNTDNTGEVKDSRAESVARTNSSAQLLEEMRLVKLDNRLLEKQNKDLEEQNKALKEQVCFTL